MTKPRTVFLFIILITTVAVIIDLPRMPVKVNYGPIHIDAKIGGYNLDFHLFGKRIYRDLSIRRGLDLQGGIHVVMEADMANIDESDRGDALSSVRNTIERRVNLFGVAEPNVQTSRVQNSYRVIVELPGVIDSEEALKLIGKTARLEFLEQNEATESAEAEPFLKTDLTGADLKKAGVSFDRQTGNPQVSLEFTSDGAKKFEELTSRSIGKMVAIALDGEIISAPRVDEVIREGAAVIRGNFTVEEAKELSIQLNAGALPVPVMAIEQRTIGATLGQESIQKSVIAGMIGLLLVVGFMWAYYGRLGFLADIALVIYGLITLALYKLIPVTLTLAGIAGFLLSVGMAVDSNILIFERIKEEVLAGKPRKVAMELGFGRAWDSIRDANVCTLITCFVLFNPFDWWFLNTSGMVRGFALTLGLGVLISLFTGIVVTRTLVRVFYSRH